MPRANRYLVAGHIYHVTHRCHDRTFLLKFAKDRNRYRTWLRAGLMRFPVSLLGYCITSNHVHLVLYAESDKSVSDLMQLVEGSMAQQYNLRKGRRGAYWEGRYHATMIDSGPYLWDCLRYVDLNMVRAGEVRDPADWEWCGYRELMGIRQRYCILDTDRLLEKIGAGDLDDFRANYRAHVERRIVGGADGQREGRWTESIAVGRAEFVQEISKHLGHRRELAMEEEEAGSGCWTLKEAGVPYLA
jgi:putative transposase